MNESTGYFELQLGKSILAFEYAKTSSSYHFAINIPSFQEQEALAWLKEKTSILKGDNKKEIQDFVDWNARAIYFYDPDKNIVEFIARKNLAYQSNKLFDAQSVVEISEIGIPTTNIAKHYHWLHHKLGLEIYSGGMHRFCAIGNEHALFICIDKTIKKWLPTNDNAYSSPFKIAIEHNKQSYNLHYNNDLITSS